MKSYFKDGDLAILDRANSLSHSALSGDYTALHTMWSALASFSGTAIQAFMESQPALEAVE
jgi:hypothetical protein